MCGRRYNLEYPVEALSRMRISAPTCDMLGPLRGEVVFSATDYKILLEDSKAPFVGYFNIAVTLAAKGYYLTTIM